jgi:hypothetical protein
LGFFAAGSVCLRSLAVCVEAAALLAADMLYLLLYLLLTCFTAAFPYALKQHLRGQHSMKELARILGYFFPPQLCFFFFSKKKIISYKGRREGGREREERARARERESE